MVAFIDDLEQRGLVGRKRHPRDRRAFLICPADAGRAAKQIAVALRGEQQRKFLAPLTQEERANLGELLTRLLTGAPAGADSRCQRPRDTADNPRAAPIIPIWTADGDVVRPGLHPPNGDYLCEQGADPGELLSEIRSRNRDAIFPADSACRRRPG